MYTTIISTEIVDGPEIHPFNFRVKKSTKRVQYKLACGHTITVTPSFHKRHANRTKVTCQWCEAHEDPQED